MNNYFTPTQQTRLNLLEQQQYGNNLLPNTFQGNFQRANNPQNNVIYALVPGIDGAKMYSIPPGKVGLLFDDQQNEFYIKSVDAMGMQSLKKFSYVEMELPAASSPSIAQNRGEIDALNKRLENLENMLKKAVVEPATGKKEGAK